MKGLVLRNCELSHEKALLALVLNSLILCEGTQSMQEREKPKLHERQKIKSSEEIIVKQLTLGCPLFRTCPFSSS